MPLYTTSQAAKLAGVSSGTIRNLTTGQFAASYTGLFSAGATPGKGAPRLFTAEDIRLLAFIRQQTAASITHEETARRIRAGELEAFTWSAPIGAEAAAPVDNAPQNVTAGTQGTPEAEAGSFALALASQWVSALESARARELELQDRLIAAETRAARFEGELTALKTAQARPWYRRLFGG